MGKKTKIILAVVLLAVLAAAAFFIWKANAPARQAGSKTVTVEVVHGDGSRKDFNIKTDEQYLRGALEQEKLVQGTEGQYGLFITAVDGETADDSKQQWWCVTKGGAQVNTGVDTTPIADGDTYELTLTTGY
jgi:hypothetical protein